MQQKISLGHHLVPAVLSRLGALAPLPPKGIVAGQAVASALMDELGLGPGVYNDIDIFLKADDAKEKELNAQDHLEREALRLGLPMAILDSYKLIGLCDGEDLNILGATEDGLLNYVWCKVNGTRGLKPTELLYSFDLNCVEVAIDLQTQELSWSPAFEHFLRTRELQVTSLGTPARTLLRYLKKKEELSAFGNDEFVMDLMACWWQYSSTARNRDQVLSRKFRELAARFKPCLESRFCSSKEDTALDVSPQWQCPPGLQDHISEAHGETTDTGGLIRLVPTVLYGKQLRAPASAKEALNRALRVTTPKEEEISPYEGMADAVQFSLWLMGWRYLSGQRSDTHLAVVQHVLAKHSGLSGPLTGLTLDEQYQCVLDLRRRAKAEGDHIYGLVESEALPFDMWNQIHRDAFFQRIEREEAQTELTEVLFEPYSEDGWDIQELVTVRQLRIEGSQMGHCVGGYGSSVASGRSRILRVRFGTSRAHWSTAELSVSSKKVLRVIQHRAANNKVPHPDNEKALNAYLEQACQKLGLTRKRKQEVEEVLF